MVERLANNASSTLTASINNTVNTLTVTSASSFPASGNFRIKIDNELMLVTSVSSNTFTVTRGVENTTAVAHTTNATVAHVLTAAALTNIVNSAVGLGSIGTTASLPASTADGKLYYTTDGPILYRDNSTGYDPFFPMVKVTPPVLSNFAWSNQGSATAVDTYGGIFIFCPSNGGGHNAHVLDMAMPSPPFTAICGLMAGFNPSTYSLLGMVLRDSNSGKLMTTRLGNDSNQLNIMVEEMSNYTSTSGSAYGPSQITHMRFLGGAIWLKYYDDGTLRHFYVGPTPYSFFEYHNESNTNFLTPDHIGFHINPYSQDTSSHIIHWTLG